MYNNHDTMSQTQVITCLLIGGIMAGDGGRVWGDARPCMIFNSYGSHVFLVFFFCYVVQSQLLSVSQSPML